MQAFIENLLDCTDRNDMKVNTAKTKEMILGPFADTLNTSRYCQQSFLL